MIMPRKSVFEFTLWARKITILDAFARQSHAKCGLRPQENPHPCRFSGSLQASSHAKRRATTFRYSRLRACGRHLGDRYTSASTSRRGSPAVSHKGFWRGFAKSQPVNHRSQQKFLKPLLALFCRSYLAGKFHNRRRAS